MPRPQEEWLDAKAGPVVRPYALTGGRTRPTGERFDVLAVVCTIPGTAPRPWDAELGAAHLLVLERARSPLSVAELAAALQIPLGVVRVLLTDLRDRALVMISSPPPAPHKDTRLLQEVLNGLRRL
jgi:hypothetical protein